MSKLYLISQTVNKGYDTYDSAIVVADNEDEAKLITPGSDGFEPLGSYGTWADKPENVNASYVGEADERFKNGNVIISSFNAG